MGGNHDHWQRAFFDVVDLDWMWQIRHVRHVNPDVQLSLGQRRGPALGAYFHEKEAGGPGLRTPMGDPGEPVNLLHQLQNVDSRSHNTHTRNRVFAVHVPFAAFGWVFRVHFFRSLNPAASSWSSSAVMSRVAAKGPRLLGAEKLDSGAPTIFPSVKFFGKACASVRAFFG
jgi:hypothetical protein